LTQKIKLPTGDSIPLFGFGTYLSKDDECYESTLNALKSGYIHIDTAQVYGNEDQVGKAIKDSGVDRKKIFITTKLWFSNYGENAYSSLEESLKKLQLDYVDLILLHTPGIPKEISSNIDQSKNKELRKNAWQTLEKFYNEGKTKAIGVSNFHGKHIDEILEYAQVPPHVNQIEYHVWNQRPEQVKYCQKNNIVVEGWGPLAQGQILKDEAIGKIAEKYNKSIAQLCIRYSLQKGVIAIPKSTNLERVLENANVFDFEISKDDIKELDSMHKNYVASGKWTHENVE